MDRHEHNQTIDIEGMAEALIHAGRDHSPLLPSDRMPGYVDSVMRSNSTPYQMAAALIGVVGGYTLRALMMIFHKIDAIELLLAQQEMRERNKEGR
jgi:hypothetical protein